MLMPKPPESHPPLSKHDLYLLLALLDQPQHGYGIIQRVAHYTGGEKRVRTSTVYSALRRMCETGLNRAAREVDGLERC